MIPGSVCSDGLYRRARRQAVERVTLSVRYTMPTGQPGGRKSCFVSIRKTLIKFTGAPGDRQRVRTTRDHSLRLGGASSGFRGSQRLQRSLRQLWGQVMFLLMEWIDRKGKYQNRDFVSLPVVGCLGGYYYSRLSPPRATNLSEGTYPYLLIRVNIEV